MAGAITALAHLFQFAAIFGHQDDDEEGAGVFGALALLILAPIAATLLQLVLSRSREYAADATGARLARDPLALAGALRKLERGAWLRPMDVNPASASMYIVHPFTGGGMMRLFQTHPPVAERITRLEAMAGSRVSQLTGGT
jgi:heat shock protein HtpX